MSVTAGSTIPATAADTQTTTAPPAQVETAPEPLMPVPVGEVPMQLPMVTAKEEGHTLQMCK